MSDIEIRIPVGSVLLDKFRKISEATGFSDLELFQKWITQEESNLHVLRHYVDQLNEMPQRLQTRPQQKSSPVQENLETQEESTKDDKKLDYRQFILQRIQSMRQEGMTFSKISAQFNEEGVVTISGVGKWYPSTISQLLAAL
ncbi:MAG: recombinase family protein [Synergistaceae bacterium]|nr:recombinase family protein [Synergistaceae bacterium]